ncbi:Uncharacterised protein [Chlamydia trachomatis]|nr:Uncharacterised protein [Chlamydia trachomatis]
MFLLFLFKSDMFLFTFQVLSPFLVSPLKMPYLLPCPPAHQPFHSGFLAWAFPYTGSRPFLPLMNNKAIIYYICSWSHEFHCTLVGGVVSGSSGGTG